MLTVQELKKKVFNGSTRSDIGWGYITPMMAREILDKNNTNNRPIAENAVKRYKNSFERGEYFISSTCIGFNSEGVLVDGQHRLEAMARMPEGSKYKIGVMFGINPSMDMDTGKKRSLRDNARIFDDFDSRFKDTTGGLKCIEYVKAICKYGCNGRDVVSAKLSNTLLAKITNYWADDLLECQNAGLFCKIKCTHCISTYPVFAAYFVAYKNGVNLDVLKRIVNFFKEPIKCTKTDQPMYGAYMKLNRMGKGGGQQLAWDQFIVISECIYRVSRGYTDGNYPKTETLVAERAEKGARYALDYIPGLYDVRELK